MGAFRFQDPLVTLIAREQARVLECLVETTSDRAAALVQARYIIRALSEAETAILFPAFSRVRLRPEQQHLLDDSRNARAEHLDALTALARRRQPRLAKLAAIQLCETIAHHNERLSTELISVLASQLPRALYARIVQAFSAHYESPSPYSLSTTRTKPVRGVLRAGVAPG